MSKSTQHPIDLYLIESKGFVCNHGYPHLQPRAHWHSEMEINFLARGSITYVWQGNSIKIQSPSLNVFWGGIPHQVVHSEDCSDCYWFYIPLPWFIQWQIPGTFTRSLLNGGFFLKTIEPYAGVTHELATFQQWHQYLSSGSKPKKFIVLLEIEAQMRRLALFSPVFISMPNASNYNNSREKSNGSVHRLTKMVQLMAREYQKPISLEQIAAAANLHPNYACQLFSRVSGRAPHTYLNQLRIAHAQYLLATSKMKIIDIAFNSGFSSLSRFYATFKHTCHCTPSIYRKRYNPLRDQIRKQPIHQYAV